MNDQHKHIILLVFLVLILFIVNYSFIDTALENFLSDDEFGIVERVIDGDTVVINKTSVRLLGINSPEKGEQYSEEAKEFLEELVFNKTVRLEFGKNKYDRYNRILAYIYFEGKNVNLKSVNGGFSNFYFPSGKDMHYQGFKEAWENCIEKENIRFPRGSFGGQRAGSLPPSVKAQSQDTAGQEYNLQQ